jgi:type II secretory pathway pseudopilin PulG
MVKYMMKLFKQQKGLTYIEMAIIIAILGIMAAFAYPYIQILQEKAREASTKANISAIKAAISIYYGDHEGIWPTTLDVNDKTPGFGFGDYLPVMPKVLVTHRADPTKSPAGDTITYKSFTADPSLGQANTYGTGWRYDGPMQSNTGRIWINSTYIDTNGVSYTTYGYQ